VRRIVMAISDVDGNMIPWNKRRRQSRGKKRPLESGPSPSLTDTPVAERLNTDQIVRDVIDRKIVVDGCRIIMLPKIGSSRGNLTFIEQHRQVPFSIKRMYYLYDVPGGETRGGHAHKRLKQFVIAISGSFDVLLDDGRHSDVVTMNRSFYGLYVPSMIWRELVNFSSGSVCAVLASDYYEEADYIRAHAEFVAAVRLRDASGAH